MQSTAVVIFAGTAGSQFKYLEVFYHDAGLRLRGKPMPTIRSVTLPNMRIVTQRHVGIFPNSIVLQELQAMRGEMSREQQAMREEFKREQQLLADQFIGLVNNFSMLGNDLHTSFRDWREECE
jgi:hypothetical protein